MISRLKRNLRLLFGRELHLFGRAVALLPRLARRPGKRQRKEPLGPRTSRRRLSRRALGASVSLLLHAGVGFALYLLWVPRPEPAVTSRAEPITIRLVRQFPIQRVKERKEPETPPPKEEVPRPAAEPVPDTEAPALAIEEDVPEALAGAPLEAPPVERLPRFEAPPLGLGTAPPQLPARGGARRQGLGSRLEGKSEALARYGGGAETEGAVERGLRWLAAHQDRDGGWSAADFSRHCRHVVACRGEGLPEFDVGVSALALLAFLGAGHRPDPGAHAGPSLPTTTQGSEHNPYRRNVQKAVEYLLSHQDGSGGFGVMGDNYLYNHALAAFAMSEAYALTAARRFRESVEAATAFSRMAQQNGGGWDYTSRETGRNDLSITGWQVMSLRSAVQAGVFVPPELLDRTRDFLDRAVTRDGTGLYANLGTEAGRKGINMVAVGLLARLYLGAPLRDSRVRKAAQRLLDRPPDWAATSHWERTFQSYYYWYTATLALFHLGGKEWTAWNFFLLRTLPTLQSRKAHEEGSWPPEPSWIGLSGGRVYATATAVLTLETYYRYEPLSKKRRS